MSNKKINFREVTRKGKGVEAFGVADCGKVSTWVRLMEGKCCVDKLCLC